MDEIKKIFKVIRPFSFTASAIPVFLGTVLAFRVGEFNFPFFVATLLGVLLLHSGTNLINDYYDYCSGVDDKEYYGSSDTLAKGILTAQQIHKLGLVCFVLAFLVASYLIYKLGIIISILFLIGFLGGYFYTANPVNYKYYALGVPGVFLLLGPILVTITYYIQTGSYNNKVLLISLPVGLLVSAILHSNDFRDISHDSQVGIKTLANILDRKLAGQFYFLLIGLAYFLIIYLVIKNILTMWALVTLITVPYAINNLSDMKDAMTNSREKAKKIELKTAKLHMKFGLLLVLAVLGANFLG